jgi:hypothetical protein
MRRFHPAFSGEWARDYQGIPARLKRLAGSRPDIRRAARLNTQVHKAVAGRLVPHGSSLLQQVGRRAGIHPAPGECDLYDRFFLTERQQVCVHDANTQFRNRILAIASDIASSGLYYHGLPISLSVPTRHQASVAALEGRSADVLRHLQKLIGEDS